MNSTIKRKRCKGDCGRYPALGLNGWCYHCVPNDIKEMVGTKRQVAKRNRDARNKVSALLKKDIIVPVGAEMKRWFDERRKEMTGFCWHCNNRSMKNNDKMFHYSIGHLLPKAYVKSVATHPKNWIELCWNCHQDFDNKMLDIINLNCFDKVVERFVAMYPYISIEERRRIPQHLLQYLETEK